MRTRSEVARDQVTADQCDHKSVLLRGSSKRLGVGPSTKKRKGSYIQGGADGLGDF